MVLRIPATVGDKSLLQDEPFKTHFAGTLSKKSRGDARSRMYKSIEKSLRETTGGLTAAEAWLSTVLGSKVEPTTPRLHAFIEFYWQLSFESDVLRVETCIRQICKEHGLDFHCPLTTMIVVSQQEPVMQRKKKRGTRSKKRFKQTRDTYEADTEYDIEDTREDIEGPNEQDVQTIAPPLPSSCYASPRPFSPSAGRSPNKNKRKARVSDSSSSDDSRESVSRPASRVSCIDSDGMTPLPSEWEDAAPTLAGVRSDMEPLTPFPSDEEHGDETVPSVAGLSRRRNPSRKAARVQELSQIISKELAWQEEMRRGERRKPSKDLTQKVSGSETREVPGPASIFSLPAAKPDKNTESSVVPAKPSPSPNASASARRTAYRRKPARKTKKVTDIDLPPSKKPKYRAAELSRLLSEAHWAGARLDGEDRQRNTRSSLKSDVSLPALVPIAAVSALNKERMKPSEDDRRKRKHTAVAAVTAPLTITIPPARTEDRKIIPRPKKHTRRAHGNGPIVSTPRVPQDTLGDSASVVHTIVNDSATSAISLLRCNDPVVEEWETEDPFVHSLPDASGHEDQEHPSSHSHEIFTEERLCYPQVPLPEYPPIWSESRQEVCESFPRFRSYQGGVYYRKDIVEGYLLGGFSARRDIFHNGGKLIISHGGGKAESVRKTDGHFQTYEATDQLRDDKSVRALLNTHHQRLPVALLIDDKYSLFPFDLSSKNCAYAVLGWYYITHAWAEYESSTNSQGRVVRYKFAFQWADDRTIPWWSKWTTSMDLQPSDEEGATVDANDAHTGPRKCATCKKVSPHVYEQGWMCLKPECRRFWTFDTGARVPDNLTYAQSFLQPVSGFTRSLLDIRPPLPVQKEEVTGPTTSWHFSKGWHCTKCGRLSSRFKWENWECSSCGELYSVPSKPWTSSAFRFQTHATDCDRFRISDASIRRLQPQKFQCEKGFGEHYTFLLPNDRGMIHILSPHPLSGKSADDIFGEYQSQAASGKLKFRRWPLRAHKCRGTLLTNYFSQNTGEPYQYVGGTANTVAWESAPSAVVAALNLIKLRMKQAGLSCRSDFNEVLSAAYMEKQKMAFHSDAEKGLGPNVASLSLGASANMYFRLHSKFVDEGGSRNALKLYLRHGDVLVMEGADVQHYYEHTVVPVNFRIAATARYIGDNHHRGP